MAHVYFHIDLNAFFANAEILLDPSLKGLPLAVAGTSRRSVVSTASYEARAFGVHSAMPIAEAMQLCPDLVIVQPHFTWYHELSSDFMAIIRSYTDEIEQASVDECYADMTETIRRYPRPLDLAWEIQKRILNELKLPCSIGVGPNMFLAKMASDMKKPLGITVLRIREVPEKLWPLKIGDMRGVGEKTVPYLHELNIKTIGDLANFADTERLKPIFGKNTDMMLRRAHGYDDREIVREWDAKSMGVSETLLEDVTDYDELRGILRTLARRLSARLKEDRKIGRTISVRIRYFDFQNNDRSLRLDEPVWKADDLFYQASAIFDDNWSGEPVRLLGISLSDFTDVSSAVQINLFDDTDSRKVETGNVLRELNHLLGGRKLVRASEASVKTNED